MSKPNSDIFSEYFDQWFQLKKEAKEKNDWEFYKWFLIETQKTFSKCYAESKWEPMQNLLGDILKTVSCELKEIMLKYKKSQVPF